jgi:hypothetical protein
MLSPTIFLALGLAAALLTICVAWLRERRNFDASPLNAEAEAKGIELLLNNLTPGQQEQYQNLGYFEVVGSLTGRRYRILHGKSRNVIELTENDAWPGRCFTPEGHLASGDCMLAQKIALENYEEDVLKTALRF